MPRLRWRLGRHPRTKPTVSWRWSPGKPIFETVTTEEEEDTVFSYPYAFFREGIALLATVTTRDGGFAVLERAARGDGQSGEDAESGQGALVFSRAPGTGQPLGAAGRRDRARRWRYWR